MISLSNIKKDENAYIQFYRYDDLSLFLKKTNTAIPSDINAHVFFRCYYHPYDAKWIKRDDCPPKAKIWDVWQISEFRGKARITTPELMRLLYLHAKSGKLGVYMSMECHIPVRSKHMEGCFGTETQFLSGERVDAIIRDDGAKEWRFYELKVSVGDFHSKAKLSFEGNRNYLVLPDYVLDKVEGEIPPDIGVLCASWDGGHWSLSSVRGAKRKELGVNESDLREAFTKSLDRQLWKLYDMKQKD